MTPPTILAIDIDGTLINSDKAITAFTRSEIHRVVEEYDARLFIVTARGPQSTAVIESRLGLRGSYAAFGGALVWARGDDGAFTVLKETPIPHTKVRDIVRASSSFDLHCGVYTRDDWFVNEMSYWGLREARNTAVWPAADRLDEPLLDRIGPVFKVMFRGERGQLYELEQLLKGFSDSVYIHNSGRVLEIIPAEAVKLPASLQLCAHFGCTADDVIAFGDSAADVEMLENVRHGVLMGNASEEVTVAGR